MVYGFSFLEMFWKCFFVFSFYLPGDFLALTGFKCDLGTFPNIQTSLMVSQDAEQISWRGQAGVSGYQSPTLKKWADSEGLLFWMLSQKQRTSQSLWMFDNFDRTFWGNSLRTDTLKLFGSSFRESFFWATWRLSQSTLMASWRNNKKRPTEAATWAARALSFTGVLQWSLYYCIIWVNVW